MEAEQAIHDSWRISKGADGRIWVRFVGPTPTNEVRAFLDVLTASMPTSSSAKVIFDLRELGGYNPEAKQPIKSWLLEHKLTLEDVTVIIPKSSTWLRMVTAAIGLAVGVKIRILDDLDGLDEDIAFGQPSHAKEAS